MKRFCVFCLILILGTIALQSADIEVDNDTKFIQTLRLFIKNKQAVTLKHVKKAQRSFLECRELMQQGTYLSEDTGFYYLKKIIDESSGTSAANMCLSSSFYQTYTVLLGFDDNIAKDTEPKPSKKVSLDFYKDLSLDNPSMMQTLFLRRIASQFATSYRGTVKRTKEQKPHAEKIKKINNATKMVLACLESDYREIYKQKRFSEPRPPKRQSNNLIKSKSR